MAWILSAFADEAAEAIDDQLAVLHEADLRYIDMRMVDGDNVVDLDAERGRTVRAKLDAAGIAVNMFGTPIGKIDIADAIQIDLDRMGRLRELADIFDCRAARIFSYYNKQNRPLAAWRDASLDRLRRLIYLAERYDLVLYHENERHIFGDRLDEVCVLRDALHRANPARFKMIFDFDNYNQSGDDVWTNWCELRGATDALHLKESQRQPDGSFQHVPSGQGDGHIPEVLAELAEAGWTGSLSLEPHLAHSPAVMATGPSGQANQALADLSPRDCFLLAAETAKQLLRKVDRWA